MIVKGVSAQHIHCQCNTLSISCHGYAHFSFRSSAVLTRFTALVLLRMLEFVILSSYDILLIKNNKLLFLYLLISRFFYYLKLKLKVNLCN